MLYMSIRMHAESPTAQVEPAAKIDIFIISSTEYGIEAAGFLNASRRIKMHGPENGMSECNPGPTHVSLQIIVK